MRKIPAVAAVLVVSCPAVFGQDALQYKLKHLTVLAEDSKVRGRTQAIAVLGY